MVALGVIICHWLAIKFSRRKYRPVILVLPIVSGLMGLTRPESVCDSCEYSSALLVVLLMSSPGSASSAGSSGDLCQEVCLYLSGVCDLGSDDCNFVHVPHSTFFLESLDFFMQPLCTLVQGENQKLLSQTQQAQKTQEVDNPCGSSQGEVDL